MKALEYTMSNFARLAIVLVSSFAGASVMTLSGDPVVFIIHWVIVGVIAVGAYFLGASGKRGTEKGTSLIFRGNKGDE